MSIYFNILAIYIAIWRATLPSRVHHCWVPSCLDGISQDMFLDKFSKLLNKTVGLNSSYDITKAIKNSYYQVV